MSASITVVAVYRENERFVVVDGSGTEHEASTPDELWRAIKAISEDPELPRGEVGPGEAGSDKGDMIYEAGCRAIGEMVEDEYGSVAGKAATQLARNGGRQIIRLLRKVSR